VINRATGFMSHFHCVLTEIYRECAPDLNSNIHCDVHMEIYIILNNFT
jgi:hypothetical protein